MIYFICLFNSLFIRSFYFLLFVTNYIKLNILNFLTKACNKTLSISTLKYVITIEIQSGYVNKLKWITDIIALFFLIIQTMNSEYFYHFTKLLSIFLAILILFKIFIFYKFALWKIIKRYNKIYERRVFLITFK